MKNEKIFLKSFLKLGELGNHLNGFSKSMSIEVSQHDPDAIQLRDRKNDPVKRILSVRQNIKNYRQ